MIQTVNHLREAFLGYFEQQGHERVASAPLVPHNDPTLMFTNAGMVPFKNVFTGSEQRPYSRAVSSQKCVRAGGKHNDLDNVGYTARHHTFFEMLGNFSFGDYFKEEAIAFAWEFLTKDLALPVDKLYATVYHADDNAYDLWKKISSLPEDRIIRISTNDNFWAMGDTGPCGPCSEIFYDHGDHIPGGLPGTPDEDGDRFVEIWNLVFMQYEQLSPEKRIDLPKPSIDTGMGLERIATVLQGVHNNYDIDLFQTLIAASQEYTRNNDKAHIASHRIIADHLRASSFLLADGVMPSNEGRGYVLRRIMRRAMRHAHQLGSKDPLMHKLVPALVTEMGSAYPELVRAQSLIEEMLKLEETRFRETLDRGLKLLDGETASLAKGDTLDGSIAFKLYDTYGFPLDLTTDILRNRSITVDEKGFNAAMQEQKERAKAAWKGSGEQTTDDIWFELYNQHGSTEFLGYQNTQAQGNVIAIIHDGNPVDTAKNGDTIQLLLNQTPFYGESGGQDGDTGIISTTDGTKLTITDTKKMLGHLHVHCATIDSGNIHLGDEVTANVNVIRRDKLRNNHSATHLLHAVLRHILGDHVTQKGSLVAEDRLRFDFSHPKAVSDEELHTIETITNDLIRQNSDVGTHLMKPEEAIEKGAMALFGEKYGDEVRVVNMGLDDKNSNYSIELCGGTHVKRTGDIGLFKIISESAIAAGIRRIEAMTGSDALSFLNTRETLLTQASSLLKTAPDELCERISALVDERKKLEKDLSDARKEAALGGGNASQAPEMINGIAVIGQHFADMPPKDLRDIAEQLRGNLDSGIVIVTSDFNGKASIIVTLTQDITTKITAPELVQIGAQATGGKGGGGKPDFAQAGGPDGNKTEHAITDIKDRITQI